MSRLSGAPQPFNLGAFGISPVEFHGMAALNRCLCLQEGKQYQPTGQS